MPMTPYQYLDLSTQAVPTDTATDNPFTVEDFSITGDYTVYVLLATDDIDGPIADVFFAHGEGEGSNFGILSGIAVELSPNPVEDVFRLKVPFAGSIEAYEHAAGQTRY